MLNSFALSIVYQWGKNEDQLIKDGAPPASVFPVRACLRTH